MAHPKRVRKVQFVTRGAKSSAAVINSLASSCARLLGQDDARREREAEDVAAAAAELPPAQEASNVAIGGAGHDWCAAEAAANGVVSGRDVAQPDDGREPEVVGAVGCVALVSEREHIVRRPTLFERIVTYIRWTELVDLPLRLVERALRALGIIRSIEFRQYPGQAGVVSAAAAPDFYTRLTYPVGVIPELFGSIGVPRKTAPLYHFLRRYVGFVKPDGMVRTHTIYRGQRVVVGRGEADVRPVCTIGVEMAKRSHVFRFCRVKTTSEGRLKDVLCSEELELDAQRLFTSNKDALVIDKIDRRFETLFPRLGGSPVLWTPAKTGTMLVARLLLQNTTCLRDLAAESLQESKNAKMAIGTVLGAATLTTVAAIGLARYHFAGILHSNRPQGCGRTLGMLTAGVSFKWQLVRLANSALHLCQTLSILLLGSMARSIACVAHFLTSIESWLLSLASSSKVG